jgi:hypothetical protein
MASTEIMTRRIVRADHGQQLSGGTTAKGLEKEEEERSTTIATPYHNSFATSPSMKS